MAIPPTRLCPSTSASALWRFILSQHSKRLKTTALCLSVTSQAVCHRMWASARFLIVRWQGTGSSVDREMKDAISLLLWLHTTSKYNSSSFDSEYCFVFRLWATLYPGSLLSQSTVSSWVCCTLQYDAHSFGWCLTGTSLFECWNHVWLSFHSESHQAFDQQWQEKF